MLTNTITEILDNLTKVDTSFAKSIVASTFKGNQLRYLNQFLDDQLTREGVITLWDEVNYTGEIATDVKIEELGVLDRLKLLALILRKVGIDPTSLEEIYIGKTDTEEYVKALAFLLNDLVNVDKIRTRNKETRDSLVVKLQTKKEPIVIQDCLLPDEPPLSKTVKVEEEEIYDIDALVV
jgi:hypothetical protein